MLVAAQKALFACLWQEMLPVVKSLGVAMASNPNSDGLQPKAIAQDVLEVFGDGRIIQSMNAQNCSAGCQANGACAKFKVFHSHVIVHKDFEPPSPMEELITVTCLCLLEPS